MKTRLCLPIQERTTNTVLTAIRGAKNFDLVEVWLDCVHDLTTANLEKIIRTAKQRIILVTRPKEGNTSRPSHLAITDILALCRGKNILVDLDLTTQGKVIRNIRDKDIQTIISFHDFSGTPAISTLRTLIHTMQTFHPSICKIATMCRTPADTLILMTLLLELRKKQIPCIILGMGREGKITRIAGSLWGNEVLYAPVTRTSQSAVGQLTQKEIQTILGILRKE